eukprot:scaffold6506_cov171-Amphora_coffeaeformis.AAC.11
MLLVNHHHAPNNDLPTIEPLVSDDLPELLKLSREEAWTHTERDWKVMLTTGQTYGHREDHGSRKLLSCIQVTDYGASLATLGMLLVANRHRKRDNGQGGRGDDDAPPAIVGYGLAKFQQANNYLLNVGPVVAADTWTALALCHRLTQHHEGAIRLDVFASQQELIHELITSLFYQQDGERQAVMLRQPTTSTNVNGVKDEPVPKCLLPGNRSNLYNVRRPSLSQEPELSDNFFERWYRTLLPTPT